MTSPLRLIRARPRQDRLGAAGSEITLAARRPNTTPSSSEFDASRFAPWTPLDGDFADREKTRNGRPSGEIRPDPAHRVMARG